MAVHRFQTPDGKIHRVEASSRAAAEAEFARATQRKPTAGDEVMGAITTLNRSIPFMDEAADGLQAGADIIAGRSKFGDAWRNARARSKAASQDFETRRPNAAALTKGVGLAVQALPVGGASAPAAAGLRGLMGSSARAAVAGGLSAQVAGYGGNGTLEQRQKVANDTTLPAMALGAALPIGVAVAGKGRRMAADGGRAFARTSARLANRASGGRLLDPQVEAGRRLGEALKADGLGPQEVRMALTEWQRTGASSPALMDLAGENTRALLRSAASKPGAGRNVAVGYANEVTADLQPNAIARTRDLTPDRRPAGEVQQSIRDLRRRVAAEDYPAFADVRVPVGDDLVSAADGAGKYLQQAYDLAMVERKFDVAKEIANLGNDPPPTMTAGALDYLRRAMRDSADEAFRGGRGELARGLGDRSRDIETALMDVPGFNDARTAYRGFSQQIDAVDEGAKVLNQVPDDFATTFAKLPAEQGGIGARQAIEEAIGRPAEGATGVLNRLSTSTNTGRNLETLYGPDEATRYRDAIGNEIDRVANARFVSPNTGSQTALREADDALVDLPPTTKIGIAKALFDKLRRGVSLTDGEREALVQLGTTIVRTGDDIPRIPTTPQAMRLLTPAERARLSSVLASAAGADMANQ